MPYKEEEDRVCEVKCPKGGGVCGYGATPILVPIFLRIGLVFLLPESLFLRTAWGWIRGSLFLLNHEWHEWTRTEGRASQYLRDFCTFAPVLISRKDAKRCKTLCAFVLMSKY